MALITLGGLTLEVEDSSQQPQVEPFDQLAICCATIVNGSNNTKILDLARQLTLEAIDDVNMQHLFRFGRAQTTGTTLVDGQSNYTLDADYFAMAEVQLEDSDGNPYRTLEYIDWNQLNTLEEAQTATGAPQFWYSRNTFRDSEIHLYPVPDASAAADYTLRTTHYERVPKPSAGSDIIDAPVEMTDVVCTYCRALMLYHKHKRQTPLGDRFLALYEKKLKAFKFLDSREPTALFNFRLATSTAKNWNTGKW
jgi:hypothetical protein